MREALLAQFEGDPMALAAHLREIERRHQDRLVSYPPRRTEDVGQRRP